MLRGHRRIGWLCIDFMEIVVGYNRLKTSHFVVALVTVGRQCRRLTRNVYCRDRDGTTEGDPSANKPNGRLMQNPHKNHKPETYDGLKLDFSPAIFKSLESYLPIDRLTTSRDEKVKYMRDILLDYLPIGTRNKDQKQREYKQRILSNYKPRHQEIYAIDPTTFFVPSFLKAIHDNTKESFRSIMSEPTPGIFTFEMLQPHFCELLLSEVENFENWVSATNFPLVRPNTMNQYGVVLDDFGLQTMLDKLMEDFICPLSKVFFAKIGGSTLDSHHGFVVEYGIDKDVDLGFHVDDSEVTLNVCLGKQFSGGELFFRGMRCEKHVHTESDPKETFDYYHVPGRAVLHHGRHRHGARATTSGHRVNLILWCRRYCSGGKAKQLHHLLVISGSGEK
ncbi:PKHD-type hydroxylase [Spatholobus suberectus]|nr:PKHD-type hydroxylase [Spatholobus suberectus]